MTCPECPEYACCQQPERRWLLVSAAAFHNGDQRHNEFSIQVQAEVGWTVSNVMPKRGMGPVMCDPIYVDAIDDQLLLR